MSLKDAAGGKKKTGRNESQHSAQCLAHRWCSACFALESSVPEEGTLTMGKPRFRQVQRALLAGQNCIRVTLEFPRLGSWHRPTAQQKLAAGVGMPLARCYYNRNERLLGPKAPKSSASQVTSQLGQRSTGRGASHGVWEGSTCFSGRGPETAREPLAHKLEAAPREGCFIFCLPQSPTAPAGSSPLHLLQPPQKRVRKGSWDSGHKAEKIQRKQGHVSEFLLQLLMLTKL